MSGPTGRDRILAASGELFHKRGFAGVSLDEIIADAGVSKAELHRHFSDKSNLGCAWLMRIMKGMSMMHENFMERPGEKTRRLRKYFLSMRNWLETNGYRSCQFANTAAGIDEESEPELTELIDRYKRSQRAFFIELVGTIVPEREAPRLGAAVFLLFSGAMTEAQNLKASWPLDDALDAAEKLCGIDSKM
ncbi:MAG: TetR/AcrR family transcriptional regulator [Verrucomicrobiota bacterium]